MGMKFDESLKACQNIEGWKFVTSFSVGGFEWLGFSKERPNKMIIISSQKTTILDCNSGELENCSIDYDEDELIAMGVYAKKGYDESNYAYDIGLNGEEVLKVAQIESTIVKSEYRGNKLQRLICEELEKIARKDDIEILSATASPYNEFSVNTFMNLGYEIKKDKLKYGGLRRYVLVKEL